MITVVTRTHYKSRRFVSLPNAYNLRNLGAGRDIRVNGDEVLVVKASNVPTLAEYIAFDHSGNSQCDASLKNRFTHNCPGSPSTTLTKDETLRRGTCK
jgi:hypothetical protein